MKYKVIGENFKFITADSRETDSETAFVVDWYSAKFEQAAREKGAAAILQPSDLARYFDVDLPIVGITGTNGKTTTAALIYSILLDFGYQVAMQGTRGYFMNGEKLAEKGLTTPMLLDNYARIAEAKKKGAQFFVTEASSHAIAQGRMAGLKFALKIHTNITGDHLDFHGDFETYRAVKNSFFADETPKIINKDDPLVEFNYANARTYALENAATFKVEAYSPREGLSGVISRGTDRAIFASPLMGRFNLYNIAAAIAAAATLLEKPLEAICDQVENFGGVAGRMEVVSQNPFVIVDFAHTSDGIEKALEALLPRKIVALFGAGGDRDKIKRPLMGKAAARFAARIILTSDNPRSEDPREIIAQIKAGCEGAIVEIEPDRALAIRKALQTLSSDEILVILGKGDETTQEIAGVKYPFSDREVVLNALKEAK
ncbi:MAG: UDP-N-acetylmuramoyl-L-alanyl-D-glutamate--2,6-diaminopimelate ligase [Helicobacteraceae bacterium]|jgi:UDP-N-acetylmuramoyl-L-alanyl-D-glutamate--2,6-diaminopimelate ligase|nr:UDP-N-acetylmuramoyl-L-alanyl-D-glutamate--2,6-diaminopimelate ligase [Helicobacteraceae bacterium]